MSAWASWLAEPLGFEFYRRAIVVSAMIGAAGGLLSVFVVVRRSALMVEALTHSLLPGIALAVLVFGLSPLAALAGGTLSALGVALGALLLARRTRLPQDASFAVLFLLGLSGGLILLAVGPAHADVGHYLLGNIIGVSDADIALVSGVCAGAVLLVVALQRPLSIALFDTDTARTLGVRVGIIRGILTTCVVLVLVAAVQAAGILLAVGFLVLPAATLLPFAKSLRSLAVGSLLLGGILPPCALLAAYRLDLPPGPAIIAGMAALAVASQLPRLLSGSRSG